MLIMAGMFFDTLEQNSTGAMGTNLKDALGIDNDQLALINTATVIGGLIGRLVGGYLADKYGRRISLGFNLLLYTLGGLISAVAINYEMLLASRLIVGIGLGGEFTVGIAMLSEMVATRYRGTLVSFLNIGSGGIGNFLSYGIFFLILGPFAGFFGGDEHGVAVDLRAAGPAGPAGRRVPPPAARIPPLPDLQRQSRRGEPGTDPTGLQHAAQTTRGCTGHPVPDHRRTSRSSSPA